ncbi:MAG: DUF3137 domain-containing protein [Muribaculaceae bacterium]|nr:DUF3137 domain-containing protein [Muribaculaceae bacterium]MDE7393754.1 DUF3137 domain-containing protein [Muribaculaceae bacterium]
MNYFLGSLNRREFETIRIAIKGMFPYATYTRSKSLSRSIFSVSGFFDTEPIDRLPVSYNVYGCVEFHDTDTPLSVYDIGVTSGNISRVMNRIPVIGLLFIIYRTILLPIFGRRIDNSTHNFRGMFCFFQSSFSVKGCVIILPDNLEDKIGYLAHNIQSLKKISEARLVVLEDPVFEKSFVVYADDEIEARKILTPAMMRSITDLRQKLGHDLMLTFRHNNLYFASEISAGFLQPARNSLKDKNLLAQLYREISFTRELFNTFS